MLEGTDLDWFRRLRAATQHELTAAGGISSIEEIQELRKLGIHAALGMAIYTGRLNLAELAALKRVVRSDVPPNNRAPSAPYLPAAHSPTARRRSSRPRDGLLPCRWVSRR